MLIFVDSPSQRFPINFPSSTLQQRCDPNGNFSMVVHGWMENIDTQWVSTMITQLLKHRGGCVFFMDYSIYANVPEYFQLVRYFRFISNVLVRKFRHIGNYDRQLCFGFSFGARLCVDAGLKLGKQTIGRMELCDPAGKLDLKRLN